MSLEQEVQELRGEISSFRDDLKSLTKDVTLAADKMHNSPCPAVTELIATLGKSTSAKIAELDQNHVRPLEDWRERVRGVLIFIGALALLGSILGGIETLSRILR